MCLEFLDVLRHSLAEAPSTYAKLGIVAHAVRMRLDGQASVILRDARSTKNLFSASTIQGEPSDHAVQRARRRGGATDWIVRHRRYVAVTDVDTDPFRANPMLLDAGIRAYCGIPLHAGDTCLGVLYSMQEQPSYLPRIRTGRHAGLGFRQRLASRGCPGQHSPKGIGCKQPAFSFRYSHRRSVVGSGGCGRIAPKSWRSNACAKRSAVCNCPRTLASPRRGVVGPSIRIG
jgi:hypothetical protein